MTHLNADAVVIGGGFYGAAIAAYLRQERQLERIILIEREPKLLSRSSFNNQARVHNGYHYPRSFTTAFRSRVNMPIFSQRWPTSLFRAFTKIYAISRNNSKVTPRQFERFCHEIGAKLLPSDGALKRLFEPRLIAAVYCVEEYAFNAAELARWADSTLRDLNVTVKLATRVTEICRNTHGGIVVSASSEQNGLEHLSCRYVFNCAYSGLNQIRGDFLGTTVGLKQELTEMALLELPSPLKELGITVMDGPFFSLMPFPALALHTLSHVRYTPHFSWRDERGVDPYQRLSEYNRSTHAEWMIRDAARYLPLIRESTYKDSLFEVKTVLQKNEIDDGRPILLEQHKELPGCYSILGGKIDNVFDILEKLDSENIHPF